jgi:hypothetical protein
MDLDSHSLSATSFSNITCQTNHCCDLLAPIMSTLILRRALPSTGVHYTLFVRIHCGLVSITKPSLTVIETGLPPSSRDSTLIVLNNA